MKITGARIKAFLDSPPTAVRAVLVYGPDEGLIRERGLALVKTVVEDPKDPFRMVDLSGSDLKTDPARLADEAAALSLTGGRRAVRIRGAADAQQKILASFLKNPVGDALIVVEAGELGAGSSLRKLFEGQDNAAALACYGDDGRSLNQVIRESLGEQGLSADPDAMAYLANHLGSDRQVTRSEIGKLALYMGTETRIGLADAMACVGDSGATSLDALLVALGNGDQAGLDQAVERVLTDGGTPVGLLRLVNRHFQRLHLAAGHMAQGLPPDQAMKRLRPPVMFKIADAFRSQLTRWTPDRLARAFELLVEAETDCKTTGLPAETVCRRTLMRIAQAGRR
ncbi:DNA polymerase III subunit delta [Magnetospira sp. QH-2]|uniref:DNA polymerase III subunit delta n=1 Tax=Magnetospira sp. (strain QH-2) TaxID=1288970 RepID=UPI0003E81572|nr:DNA polymerase III subunit delta [Magnetospira sp. QH-2]CCQ75606.1 putative DNA polymerase III subunit delta [Magnetospira sp. QH-2]